MIRRLLTSFKMACLGLCLVLALAAAALWVRKATWQDQFSYARLDGRLWVIGSRSNGLYLTVINGWPNDEPPRLYSLANPEEFIGPDIGVSRGTFWQKFGMFGVNGSAHVQLRHDGTGPWRRHPLGVRPPEPRGPEVLVGKARAVPSEVAGAPSPLRSVTSGALVWAPPGMLGARGRPVVTPPIFEVFVPHWMPVALFIAPPVAWAAWRLRRAAVGRRRQRQGRCVGCGYDLRASSGRCPECGRDAAPVPVAAAT